MFSFTSYFSALKFDMGWVIFLTCEKIDYGILLAFIISFENVKLTMGTTNVSFYSLRRSTDAKPLLTLQQLGRLKHYLLKDINKDGNQSSVY